MTWCGSVCVCVFVCACTCTCDGRQMYRIYCRHSSRLPHQIQLVASEIQNLNKCLCTSVCTEDCVLHTVLAAGTSGTTATVKKSVCVILTEVPSIDICQIRDEKLFL
jgi:hypothetical protein